MLDRSRLCARDFMQSDVLAVSIDTSLRDIHRLFLAEEIHGAPVVDEDGNVCGVITSLDLLRPCADELESDRLTAVDVMTREIVAVSPDLPIAQVAQMMRHQHVHRVLVITDRELLGVLTTFDLLRAFAQENRVERRGSPRDVDPST